MIYRYAQEIGILRTTIGRRIYELCYFRYKRYLEAGPVHILKQYVEANTTVLDVGANIGFFTSIFSHWVAPSGKVVAFEPEKVNFNSLSNRVGNSSWGKYVQIENQAVAEITGDVYLEINPLHPGDHKIGENGKKVFATTIDEYLQRNFLPKVSFIKVDVQGFEFNVIKGAEKTIFSDQPTIFLEADQNALIKQSTSVEEVIEWLKQRGYSAHIIKKNGQLEEAKIQRQLKILKNGYLDILFLPSKDRVH